MLPNYESDYHLLSDYSSGNTRVLAKLLVRALRLADLNGEAVTEDIVQLSKKQIIM